MTVTDVRNSNVSWTFELEEQTERHQGGAWARPGKADMMCFNKAGDASELDNSKRDCFDLSDSEFTQFETDTLRHLASHAIQKYDFEVFLVTWFYLMDRSSLSLADITPEMVKFYESSAKEHISNLISGKEWPSDLDSSDFMDIGEALVKLGGHQGTWGSCVHSKQIHRLETKQDQEIKILIQTLKDGDHERLLQFIPKLEALMTDRFEQRKQERKLHRYI